MKKYLFLALYILISIEAFAAAPTYETGWEYNNDVTIDYIYTYSNNASTQVHMNNGQFCYINSAEKELLSTILSMRATNSVGQIVCYLTADKQVDGKASRHIHRIKY